MLSFKSIISHVVKHKLKLKTSMQTKRYKNELDSIGGRPPISRQLFLAQMDQF